MRDSFHILLLPGDGIGPEVVAEAVRVLEAVAHGFGHDFVFTTRLMGGCSIDAHGVALTDEVLADCRAAGVEPGRLRHVPLGMRLASVSDEDIGRVRERYGLGNRFVLSVGTLEPRKNLGRLLDAFALLPQRDVTLAVVGPDGWGASLGPRIDSLDGRARLLGFVPQADLAPLYRAAAAVCYPSLLEGYGLPVAEALGAGAAVVTSAGTATEELVTGGAGLAVDARDVDAIAGALASVLDDEDLAQRLRRGGLARAARTAWDVTAERTIAAYREVA